ncbi:RNA polymerase sigma 70 [Skermanella stibiiresistens SB22]|uniref:RNA polymerase sigma 70 n=1 Tax=Skermanella stibiiresistens SB22 TaxID=1385369 RepID=W9H538_9PROT|nr:RNA polymerase factor sigma-32 [Skermanella stibiiresistens]EWY41134.1 RNA polymerase sigma 70 [Skermanella stibiiresistens SB22]
MSASFGWASGCLTTLAHRLPYLSPDEERDLALRSAAGDERAAERLVETHLRVVVRIARSYGRFGLPVNELIQEGTLGLIQAVRKFNPDGGARLGTYAMWWIRAAIQDYVVRSWSLVRVGKTAAHKALFFALKRVAAERRTSSDKLDEAALTVLASRFDMPPAEVSGLAHRIARLDRSLDVPAHDADGDETESLLDQLPADQPSPEELVEQRSIGRVWHGLIDRALAMLPAREAAIIRHRHMSEVAPTFEAIGRELGISKDRVRQLEKRALARLRELLQPLAAAHGLPGN